MRLKGHLTSQIKDIEISNDGQWKKKHLKTIIQNYQKAPYFDNHKNFIESVYQKEWKHLIDLNNEFLFYMLDLFQIKTEIIFLSQLGIKAAKQELIKEICLNFSASEFIFGPEGRSYAEKKEFQDIGVDISFHDYNQVPYTQLWGDFVPNLSALDLLLNVKPEKLIEYFDL